jgi:hypothetical protein
MEKVEVHWIDSQAFSDWQQKPVMQKWDEDLSCVTVGYLLRVTKERIVLVMSESSTCFAEGLSIPWVAIIKIGRLSVAQGDNYIPLTRRPI